MFNKKRRVSILFGFFLALIVGTASAQGNCPPDCKCHRVDNQFIVDCNGNKTTVPPTQKPQPTQSGQTREPGKTPNGTPQPTAQGTPSGNYITSYCQLLPAGSYGMNCPGNLYDVVYACGPGYSFCWYVSVSCAACVVPTAMPTRNPKPLPCADVDFSQGGIQCTIGWDRRVAARIPPVSVNYEPYPRGIVYDAMQFTLPPLVTQSWQCSAPLDGWDPDAWAPSASFRNLVFCLRWREIKNPEPTEDPAPGWAEWYWDEREWGNPKSDLIQIPQASHTYVTSSAEKPMNGFNNLPSYQVRVRTFWVVEWKETWEQQIEKCVPSDNPNSVCKGESSMRSELEWVSQGRNGVVDLRYYGNAHFWSDSTLIQTPWGKRMNVLPVPVIEVQGVIKKP